MISDKAPYDVSVIDFPQMVSTDHVDAKFYFDRDVACVERLFRKKHNFTCERDQLINFEDIEVKTRLDREVQASGYWKWAKIRSNEVVAMEKVLERDNDQENNSEYESESEDEGQEELEDSSEYEDASVEENNPEVQTEVIENTPVVKKTAPQETPVSVPADKKVQVTKTVEPVTPVEEQEDEVTENGDEEETTEVDTETAPTEQGDEGEEEEGEIEEGDGEGEEEEVYELTPEQLAKQEKYIKRALRNKFKKKKRFKTNKNKMKAIANLKKEIYL